MEIKKFKELLICGFDIEFNIDDVFYSFTKAELNDEVRYYIGNENHTEHSSFLDIEEMLNYKINNVLLSKIIESINENEVNY